jgi:hypothetical protein
LDVAQVNLVKHNGAILPVYGENAKHGTSFVSFAGSPRIIEKLRVFEVIANDRVAAFCRYLQPAGGFSPSAAIADRRGS